MKFTISREALLRPLTLVAGVVERRQTLPVLSNVLIQVEGDQVALTGTDLEVELVGRTVASQVDQPGAATVPARKLMDICKSLPDQSDIQLAVEDGRAVLRSGRSRFTLSTLPVAEFPNIEDADGSQELSVPRGTLKHLIESTSFAMAQQDVRYYLNGMLLEIQSNLLRTVATDGHRLAMCSRPVEVAVSQAQKLIVPRKGILELSRLLDDSDEPVSLTLGATHVRAHTGDFTFTSKLIDGKFPDYGRVIPANPGKASAALSVADGSARLEGAEEVLFRVAPDLAKSGVLERIETDAVLGERWALQISASYKGVWVRSTRLSQPDAAAAQWFARAAGRLGSFAPESIASEAPGKLALWTLEACMGTHPLSVVAHGPARTQQAIIPPAKALPAGALAIFSAQLDLPGGAWHGSVPVIMGGSGQPARVLTAEA